MPQALPILGNIALNLALGVAASVVSNALRPKQSVTAKSSTGNRGISFELEVGEERSVSGVFGEGATAGHLVYVNQYGDNDQYLQLKIDIGHCEHDGLSALIVDEEPMTLSGSNSDARGLVVEQKKLDGSPTMWIKTYTGVAGQVADPELVSRANPGSRWGTAHRATGVAYHVVTLKVDNDVYGSTLPRFRFAWRGVKLYDWRKDSTQVGGAGAHRANDPSTFEFTRNLYVIRWNYRVGLWLNGVKALGLGVPALFNDIEYFTAAANLADEQLTDPTTSVSYARYEYGREILDSDEYLTILREMDEAGCGASFSRGGADAPVPAQSRMPVMTLTDNHRLSGYPVKADLYGAVSTKKSFYHGTFLNQSDGWVAAPFPPRKSASLETLIGGRREQPMRQLYERQTERAQMRAEIFLRQNLFPATRTETFGPRALALEPGDAITRSCEWGDMVMVVESRQRLAGNIGVELTLSEWSNSIVPTTNEDFVIQPGVGGSSPAAISRTLAVSAPDIQPYQRESAGGAQSPMAKASWSLITDPNVEQVMIRIWPTSGSEANDAQDYLASARLTANKGFGPIAPDTDYTGKIIPIRSDARTCTWSNTISFTTGPEVLAAGSINLPNFSAAIQASLSLINNTNAGSVHQKLDDIAAEIVRQANINLTTQANEQRSTTLLRNKLGNAEAAIVTEGKTRVTATDALAVQITEAIAAVGDNFAGGLIKFEVAANEVDGYVRITIKAYASSESESSFAMTYWDVKTNGDTRIVNVAKEHYWLDDEGEILQVILGTQKFMQWGN